MKYSELVQGNSFVYPGERVWEDEPAMAQPLGSTPSPSLLEGLSPSADSSPSPGNSPNSKYIDKKHEKYLLYVQYTSNQSQFFDTLANQITECKPKFIVTRCQCGRHVLPQTCMKLSCIKCASFLSYRRARSAMRRFMKYRPSYQSRSIIPNVIYTVFTMPLELRQKYSEPKIVKKLRGELWTILKKNFGALFALEGTHPISEEHPEKFHPHLNFLWVQKPGHRPFIDIAKMRAIYQKLLGYKSDVNLYSQYSNKAAKIWKWCQYITRVFPSMSKWCGPTKWYGRYPKSDQKETFSCPECGEKIYCLGYVDSYQYKTYQDHGWKVGRDPPWENDNYITTFKSIRKTA